MKPEAPLPDLKVPRIVMNYRRPVVVVAHLALWTLSFYGAFFLRFDGHIPGYYLRLTPYWVVPLLLLPCVTHALFCGDLNCYDVIGDVRSRAAAAFQ